MTQKEKIAKAMEAQQMVEVRRRVISGFFAQFAVQHLKWLKGLTLRYMESDGFELNKFTLLPAYYKERADKEIAVFAALMIPGENHLIQNVSELRDAMGDCPHRWFVSREYTMLSVGDRQNDLTCGVPNWRIAQYFERLWQESKPFGYDLQTMVKFAMNAQGDSLEAVIDWLVGEFVSKKRDSDKRMLSLVLSASDGIGLGLWDIDPFEVKCPLTDDVRAFLRLWIPNYVSLHDIDFAINFFGFGHPSHVLYACWAYNALHDEFPEECAKYEKLYKARYEKGVYYKPREWKRILPMPELVSP